jgi:predicted ATPase
MKFRIIAIRPLKGCNQSYLKVLQEDKSYVFFNRFDFSAYTDIHPIIQIKNGEDVDLYSVKRDDGRSLSIQVSAIVGKNGSGKSTIVELFYAAIYNIAVIEEILFDEERKVYLDESDRIEGLKVEIFFESNNELYALRLDDEVIKIYKSVNGEFSHANIVDIDLKELFYSIAINYSHYALNSTELGEWLDYVFHKNDSYQTPIVINPMRKEGNIDINIENHLVRARLLSNILLEDESQRTLIDDKKVKYLMFSLNSKKTDEYQDEKFSYTNKYGGVLFPIIYEVFLGTSHFVPEETILNEYVQEYVLRKTHRIAERYKSYFPYKDCMNISDDGFISDGKQLKEYVAALKQDSSHITLKLRQAIYFLRYGSYLKREDIDVLLDIDEIAEDLLYIQDETNLKLIELLPPSIFISEIFFEGANTSAQFDPSEHSFEKLSSGEKQYIFSLSSLLYHLYNLDSVHSNSTDSSNKPNELIRYKYVNVIFDEIELYYHPDLQRRFVHDIVNRLKKAQLKYIEGVNLLFVTHSPFILSDIPSSNILFLDRDGEYRSGNDIKTFGANIHDLLKHAFFLEKGTMGEFAKSKINEIIRFLNRQEVNKQEEARIKALIELIDEPLLKHKLREKFEEVTTNSSALAFAERQALIWQEKVEKLKEQNNK